MKRLSPAVLYGYNSKTDLENNQGLACANEQGSIASHSGTISAINQRFTPLSLRARPALQ